MTVKQATADYLADEDAMGRWLEECGISGEYFTATSVLFANWHEWCEINGEQPGSQKRFSQNLEARGYSRRRTADARGFDGLALRAAQGNSPQGERAQEGGSVPNS